MAERRVGRGAAPWPLLLILLLLTAVVSLDRGLGGKFDFHHFYADAEYTWQHGALNPDLDNPDLLKRRQLPFYLPIVPLAIAPMAFAGPTVAAVLWTLWQLASLLVCWRLLQRWSLLPGSWWGWLLAIPVLYESARFNQLGLPVLALVLLGHEALCKRRTVTAGVWFAHSILLKLLPAVLVPWLLLKRRWRAAGGCVLGGAAICLLPCLIVFGPSQTGVYLGQWWKHNVQGAPARGMTDASLKEHFIDHRNQSLPAIVARATVADHPHATTWQVGDWRPETARRVGLLILGAIGLAGMWVLRRPGATLSPEAEEQEISLLLLAMLILGPLLRTYYLVWALPALLLLCGRMTHGNRWAYTGVLLWLGGLLGWISPEARSLGVHWFVLVGMGICVVGSAEATEDHRGVVPTEAE